MIVNIIMYNITAYKLLMGQSAVKVKDTDRDIRREKFNKIKLKVFK